MKKIKVAVIGIGGIARSEHIPALLKNEGVELYAVCDSNPAKMDCELILKGVKKFVDYNELLKDKEIESVHICTPNYLHSQIAIAALNSGKNVFCEKPDAISIVEMQKVIEAEKSSKKVFMVMRNNRHLGSSKYIKNAIMRGDLGDIYCGRCGWIRRRGIPGRGGWFTTKEQSGGGPLIDLGVHMIDLAVYLMGNPKAVAVSGSTYCKFANSRPISDSTHSFFGEVNPEGTFDVEDLAMGFIKFENGASLQIEFSWASNVEEECKFLQLRGDKGGVDFNNDAFKLYTELDGVLFNMLPSSALSTAGHTSNINHFIRVLQGKEKADYDSSQGLNMISILSAIYESARTGKEITL